MKYLFVVMAGSIGVLPDNWTFVKRKPRLEEEAGGGARWSKEQGGAEAISWILLCSQDDVFMFDIKTLGEEAWMWSKEQGGREGAENGVDYQVWSSVQCPVSSGI